MCSLFMFMYSSLIELKKRFYRRFNFFSGLSRPFVFSLSGFSSLSCHQLTWVSFYSHITTDNNKSEAYERVQRLRRAVRSGDESKQVDLEWRFFCQFSDCYCSNSSFYSDFYLFLRHCSSVNWKLIFSSFRALWEELSYFDHSRCSSIKIITSWSSSMHDSKMLLCKYQTFHVFVHSLGIFSRKEMLIQSCWLGFFFISVSPMRLWK